MWPARYSWRCPDSSPACGPWGRPGHPLAEVHMSHCTRFVVRGILVAGSALVGAAGCSSDPPAERQAPPAAVTSPSFLEFETGQVRPIALSPDGTRLFAVNTPNGSLEIFN